MQLSWQFSISGTLKKLCVCTRFIHNSLIFAFSMGKNERDVEQKKEERAQSKIYAQRDAILREVKSTVEFLQMSVLKT